MIWWQVEQEAVLIFEHIFLFETRISSPRGSECGNRISSNYGSPLPSFYRTTPTHSETMPWQDVCLSLSVHLSVRHTPVLCVNNYTYPQIFFTVGSPRHPSSFTPNGMAIFQRGPPYWVHRMQGGFEKITIYDKHRFISELMQGRAIVTMEGE